MMAVSTQTATVPQPGVFTVSFEDISMARDIKKAISMVRGVTKVCRPRAKRAGDNHPPKPLTPQSYNR